MAVLSRGGALAVLLIGLAGCYSPAVRDCTVSCAAPDDCTGGQICGADRMCAAPEVAGRCRFVLSDAGVGRDAGPRHDAPLDAPPRVAVHVLIAGKGSVAIDDVGTCSTKDPSEGACTFQVAPGIERTAHAIQVDKDWQFAAWLSGPCTGQGETCTFTPAEPITITPRFERDDGLR